jgi:hypothetical protein
MGANNGTGWPLYFWCAACKKKPGWKWGGHKPGWNVVRTGRTRPYKGGNLGVRGLNTFHEYTCADCGHVGWSRHKDIARKPLTT